MNKTLLSLLFFTSTVLYLCSQEYIFDRYGVGNEFPTDEIYRCLSDKKGYKWIASEAGLYRFNGIDFEHIIPKDGPTFQSVYEVHIDKDENIWFLGSDGKVRRQSLNGEQTVWANEGTKPSAFKMGFACDGDDQYWIGSFREGLYKITQKGVLEQKLHDLYVGSVYKHSKGLLLVSSDNVCLYRERDQKLDTLVTIDPGYLTRATISNRNLYVFADTDVYVIDTSTLKTRDVISLPREMQVIHASSAPNGDVMIGTRTGLFQLGHDGVISCHNLSKIISHKPVSCYHEDNYGNIWITTLTNGLYRFYKPKVSKVKEADVSPIKSVTANEKGKLFLGSNKGSYSIQKGKNFQSFEREWKHSGEVLGSIQDSSLTWLVTQYDLTLKDGTETISIEMPCRDYHYDDKTNELYIVYLAGVFKITPTIMKLLHQFQSPIAMAKRKEERDINLFKGNTRAITSDESGKIWFVGKYGLASYDGSTISLYEKHSLLTQSSIDITSDGDKLYISTLDEDIIQYDIRFDTAQVLLSGDKTCARFIHDIQLGPNKTLWLGHNNGVTEYNIISQDITCYSKEDGLPKTQVNSLLTTDSIIYVGTDMGLYTIRPGDTLSTSYASLGIKGFSIWYDMEKPFRYHIRNKQGFIELDPLAIGYNKEVLFQYSMGDGDPPRFTADDQIPLDRIRYGHNNLRLGLIDGHGQEISNLQLQVNLIQPFYKNKIFQGGVFLLLFLLLYTGRAQEIVEKLKTKVIDYLRRMQPPTLKLTIKLTDGTYASLPVEDIYYMKSAGNYIEVHSKEGRFLTRMTMRKMLTELNGETPLRQVHRSYIANVRQISAVDHKHVFIDSQAVPYSMSFKKVVEPLKNKVKLQPS